MTTTTKYGISTKAMHKDIPIKTEQEALAYAAERKRDVSPIPPGKYCYRVVPRDPGDTFDGGVDRYGMELREYSFGSDRKQVACPHWWRTEYGTVQCRLLDFECADEFEPHFKEKIQQHFGVSYEQTTLWICDLADEFKVCEINMEEPDDD